IGEETVGDLFNAGLIKNAADLYTLTVYNLMSMPGFGQRSAERILQGLDESRKVGFERVIYALSIPFVGETVAKKLARATRSIDNLMSLSAEELEQIDDIGPRIAASITAFFSEPTNREMIERLRSYGLQMEMPPEDESSRSDRLAGKSIVISGTFTHHSRDQYKEMIERNGGKNVGSISKKTDYLLAGDNMGPAKLEKATKLGIPIIDEDTFLSMIS
ncbi:MAG: NAD-dependent DNA ligase LigA, partial [Paramuribaculum sp.]|nr:NAD-dependent DNA ligase LigA [Paramuribaculum sp.]